MRLLYFSLGLLLGLMILVVYRKVERKKWIKFQQDLVYRMNHDSLTGIYNRDFFESECNLLNESENSSVAILVCDLDDLKVTNDTYGHKQGDELIKSAARVLQDFSSENTTVARLGGDEFVLLVTETAKGEAKQLVSQILNSIHEYNTSTLNLEIKLSIGFAFTQNSLGQMTKLFAQADQNMYSNKNERKLLTCVK
jgi:diguanylate cyclase (GGDEF)-like protein